MPKEHRCKENRCKLLGEHECDHCHLNLCTAHILDCSKVMDNTDDKVEVWLCDDCKNNRNKCQEYIISSVIVALCVGVVLMIYFLVRNANKE